MTITAPLPKAVDLSHHFSLVQRTRPHSPFKDLIHAMRDPLMLSLAGGLPHPSFFPFTSIKANVYPSSTVLDPGYPVVPSINVELSIPREPSIHAPYSITSQLQYTSTAGSKRLLEFVRELTQRLCQPAFSDWTVLLNSGGTDGWNKVITMLCNRGEYIICEEQVYPTAQSAYVPMGCTSVPITVDDQGMRPDALRSMLDSWPPSRGRRPRVMYLVPVGQNPLGSTMNLVRKKEIYNICADYDIIIVEDDPYTVMQYSPYILDGERTPPAKKANVSAFLNEMSKSFLAIDVQGRVIRLDTFSKVIAPGSRLGWFTCNEMFAECLLQGGEVQTHAPSGFSQMMIGQLLEEWGIDGYLEWVTNLREQYRVRRDWMLDAISEYFEVVPAEKSSVPGALGFVAYAKGQLGLPIFSFVPPTGGMFVWCTVYYHSSPFYKSISDSSDFEREFWLRLIRAHVLVTPGWYYAPWQGEGKQNSSESGIGHFRLAFSYESKADMEEALRRLSQAMLDEWTGLRLRY